MKKITVLAIMLIFIVIPVVAQRNKDVLYLKNGSMIYGKLMEVTDNQYKIRSSDGSIFIYSSQEVDKFVNENVIYDGRKKNGLGFALEAGFLVGAQTSDYKAPFSFNILGNFTGNTKNIFSLGSGVEYLGQPYTPLFLEYKFLFTDRKRTPFMFFRGGKLLYLREDSNTESTTYPTYLNEKSYSGGATFTIGTGISWDQEGNQTYLSFAYRNAHTSYSQKNYYGYKETFKNAYNRLEVKFGFMF
jgi:hypothetical protein